SLQALTSEQQSSAQFQKAVDLFAHIMAARQMWLFRWGLNKDWTPDLFPKNVPFEALDDLAEKTHVMWSSHLAGLNDNELSRVFEYQSIDGKKFRNSVEDILTQLFGHSWYHRGQIAQLVKSLGGEPAITDFVYWCREAIED
ncbi:MAG TPA: DinB family protein, partial [Blastocatellia bacterium]|nr:DinB family protein [Blastocatellia bacterium]